MPSTLSSAATGRSVPWTSTVALGERMVREWGDRPDTTVRWMAHWVAELMERPESAETPEAREEAQRACAEAIQTLWARRQHWPYGAPLQRVVEALNALAGPPERFEKERPEPEAGWAGAMSRIDRLGSEEWQIVRQAAIAEIDLSEEQTILDTSPEDLEDNERELFEALIKLQARQKEAYFKLGSARAEGFGELSSEEKQQRVQDALAAVEQKRAEVLTHASATSPMAASRAEPPGPADD